MGAEPHANQWERNCFLIIIPQPFHIFLINKAKQNLHTLQITFAEPAPDWNVFVYAEKSCVNGGGPWGESMCVSEARPEQAAEPLVSELCFLGMWNRLESIIRSRENSLESLILHFTQHLMTAFLNEFAVLCFPLSLQPNFTLLSFSFPLQKAYWSRILF